jgi:hypothetical protein
MTDPDDFDDRASVIDGIGDAIGALPYAVHLLSAAAATTSEIERRVLAAFRRSAWCKSASR